METRDVFLWEKNMSSYSRRIYGYCMEDVFLLEKDIWLWKMSSCWIRRYGYGRRVLVGEEYMGMLLKTFLGALRLAASVFVLMLFSERIRFLKLQGNIFCKNDQQHYF